MRHSHFTTACSMLMFDTWMPRLEPLLPYDNLGQPDDEQVPPPDRVSWKDSRVPHSGGLRSVVQAATERPRGLCCLCGGSQAVVCRVLCQPAFPCRQTRFGMTCGTCISVRWEPLRMGLSLQKPTSRCPGTQNGRFGRRMHPCGHPRFGGDTGGNHRPTPMTMTATIRTTTADPTTMSAASMTTTSINASITNAECNWGFTHPGLK